MQLWKKAAKRVAFKRHFLTYLLVNILLWGIYFFSEEKGDKLPWPVWVSFFWGIGLLSHFFKSFTEWSIFSVDKEYEKLKNRT